jgi:hypothetical protein
MTTRDRNKNVTGEEGGGQLVRLKTLLPSMSQLSTQASTAYYGDAQLYVFTIELY